MLQPYQEQGIKDKERYTKELQEYRERLQSDKEDATVEQATTSVKGNEAEEEGAVVDADDALDDIIWNSTCASNSVSNV